MIFIPNTPQAEIKASIIIQMVIITLFLFDKRLSRKNNFVLRFIFINLLSYLYACNIPLISNSIINFIFVYTSIFASQIFAIKFCYNEPIYTAIFIAAASKTTEHITSMLYSIFSLLDIKNLNFGYGGKWTTKIFLIYLLISLSVYILEYFIIVKPMNFKKELKFRNISIIILVLTSILVNELVNLYTIMFISAEHEVHIYFIIYFLSALCGILVITIQFGMFNNSDKLRQLETLSLLWNNAQKQYNLSKQNIDSINLKCHNLKYRISELRNSSSFSDIIKEIDFYDSNINTNNEVLDILFTEKRSYCNKMNIQFSCIANGSLINFMDNTDIYVLFGNILDNAINAVLKLEQEYEKNIYVTIKRENSFIIISTENLYNNNLLFRNNLPVPNNKSNSDHGYGIFSIKNIVEKYEGCLTINTKDSIFSITILIPI